MTHHSTSSSLHARLVREGGSRADDSGTAEADDVAVTGKNGLESTADAVSKWLLSCHRQSMLIDQDTALKSQTLLS